MSGVGRTPFPFPDRFWSKVTVGDPDECWPWTATTDGVGYGSFSMRKSMVAAHRMAYMLCKGDPGALDVCHTCDVRRCCNPAHLFLATHLENMEDRDRKGRNVNHVGSRHGMAKLSERCVVQIRKRIARGEKGRAIAREMGLSETTVSMVKRHLTWRHVP